jgi:hypothetical protein
MESLGVPVRAFELSQNEKMGFAERAGAHPNCEECRDYSELARAELQQAMFSVEVGGPSA